MRTKLSLLTFGHGTAEASNILELLGGAGVQAVVDVRRFPGSRRHPHVVRSALEEWLPAAGVAYRWEPRLGGRRHVPVHERVSEVDSWWRVAAFRAYAAHTRSGEFAAAMHDLLGQLARTRLAVMCSESLWWRCHRRLIADVAVLVHGVLVRHLGHDGKLTEHVPSAGARVAPEGLVYDVEDPPES